ncbi:MAG: DEAD/DEAH box helicase [Chloroflexi bacterium]|nr:DEAD/DEAH box helicase [Chloroflexota bacterium]
MDTSAFLQHLRSLPFYRGQIAHVEPVPVREAQHAHPSYALHHTLETSLRERGWWPLFTHQAAAVDALAAGHNVVVATGTASGKTLCYNLPVADGLLRDPQGRALYLFPTKALAQDQLRALHELAPWVAAATFDGDTPASERAQIRGSAQVVITNPDMLHLGIMPNHQSWSKFLRHLQFVVVDEVHLYRGVFGSHLALVLRRLRRLCQYYGSYPLFIAASATIANPRDHVERLTGLPFHLVNEDGSPYGGKDFVLWNPPVLNKALGTRRSTTTEATSLFVELVRREVRTLAFVRTRRLAELVYRYAAGTLSQTSGEMAGRIRPYRAGYLPEDRRRIEQALFRGELLGVSTTSALELGIDVGTLDATVLAGYPGSVASTWQQAGRSGRRGERSLSILVAQDNPLDQYFMNHPDALFGRPQERALTDPDNPYILIPHLACAAYELPLTQKDGDLFGPRFMAGVAQLEEQGWLHTRHRRWFLSAQARYPAESVNIRTTSAGNYAIVEVPGGRLLETIEAARAFTQVHPGAVYLHQGETYLVTELDMPGRTVYVEATDVPYYTQVRETEEVQVKSVLREDEVGATRLYLGAVEVTSQVLSFVKRRPYTEEVMGEEPLDLDPQRFPTIAFWCDIPPAAEAGIAQSGLDFAGGLHAAEHACIGLLPLFALCDRLDIGGLSTPLHPDTGKAQIFIYDGHPGGIGISEKGFEIARDLWRATLETIEACPCEAGCPSCVQSPKCGNNNQPLDKAAAALLLRAFLGLPQQTQPHL